MRSEPRPFAIAQIATALVAIVAAPIGTATSFPGALLLFRWLQ